MHFRVESIKDVVNLVSLGFLSSRQHFCSTWCGDDMLVRWDMTGEKISDALPEMEHLSFEVLQLSLATSFEITEFTFFFAHCVLAQAMQSCGDQGCRGVRVMVKALDLHVLL